MLKFLVFSTFLSTAFSLNCAPGWTGFDGTKLCYLQMTGSPVTQPEASADCVKKGGKLASINSKEENDFLAKFAVTSAQLSLADQPWIGLVRTGRLWSFQDNSTDFGFQWAKDEPNNIRSHENCTKFVTEPGAKDKYSGKFGVLNDTPCDRPSTRFICRAPEMILLADPIVSAPAVHQLMSTIVCSPGWTGFDVTKSCYLHVNSKNVTQDEAEAQCNKLGGHLASISNVEENKFLSKLAATFVQLGLADQPWIGAKKIGPAKWKNTDGSAASYLPWGPLEPNNIRNHEDCIKFVAEPGALGKYGGKQAILNDTPCDRTSPRFICKKPQIL